MKTTSSYISRLSLITGVSVIGILLSGCASLEKFGPDATVVAPQETVPAPAAWTAVPFDIAPEDLPATDWVASFDDAQLLSFVTEGLEANPGARRALAQFDASIARLRVSRADLYPTVSANGSVTRSQGGIGFNTDTTSYNLGVNTRWETDLFGRIRTQIDADRETAKASASDLAAIRLSIAGRIAQTWFDVIEAERLIDLSARDIQRQERFLRLTDRRFSSGISGSSDVRLARSSLANAQALEATRKQNYKFQMRALEVLLGRYPDASMQVPADLPELPVLTGAAAPNFVLNRRPDILAVEQRIAAGGYSVDAARKALYPTLSLSGSGSEQGFNLGDILDLKGIAFQIAGQLTAPLYQGGRIRANIEAQEANLRVQLETYVETALQAYQEVENALDAEQRLREREEALRVSLDEALKAEERLESRYVEGLATILQLLDSQSRSLNAEGQLISARAERLQNRVRLHVALGGGAYGDIPDAARPVLLSESQG